MQIRRLFKRTRLGETRGETLAPKSRTLFVNEKQLNIIIRFIAKIYYVDEKS